MKGQPQKSTGAFPTTMGAAGQPIGAYGTSSPGNSSKPANMGSRILAESVTSPSGRNTGDAWSSNQALVVTAAWICFWVVLSVSIIIVNKHVLFYSGFRFPFCLAVWHMFLGTITSKTAVWVLKIQDTIKEQASTALYLQVGVIGIFFGGTLVTGNAALLYLTVPTVQMLKASGPAAIYAIGIIMGNERLALTQSIKVLVVCTGVGIASYGDLTLSATGFLLQIVSIMLDATRCCSLQRVLQTNHIEVGPLVTLAHVAPFAMAALVLPAGMYEGPRLLNDYDKWKGALPMVLLSGLLASVLNFVVFKIIRLTSALTTSLSGVIKEWACILVAMLVYGTTVTRLQWLGYSIAIAGLMWYQSGRLRALQNKQALYACADNDEEEGLLDHVRSRASEGNSRNSSCSGECNSHTASLTRSNGMLRVKL